MSIPAPALARGARDPGADLAAIVRLLEELVQEVRGLCVERAGASCDTAPRTKARDTAILVRLLPAIFATAGSAVFTVAELIEHANLPTAPAQALRAALGPVDAGASRRLGKLFRRAAGAEIDGGFSISRVGDERGGALWAVKPPTNVSFREFENSAETSRNPLR